MLDDAAYFAVNSQVEEVLVLTVSFHLHFLRPATVGTLISEGRVVRMSSTVCVADAVLRDDTGRELARGTGDFVRSRATLAGITSGLASD